MTDYTKSTGNAGTMMIRDTGTYVEFWLKGASGTFSYDLPWRYTINGSTSSWQSFDFVTGGQYQRLGRWNITTDQTVTFYLGDTGTSGLGGPTTLSAFINRTSAPKAPTTPSISSLTSTSFVASFSATDNGGLATTYQLGYGTSSSSPQTIIASDGSTSITGREPGTTHYVWARAHNSKGYSPWSGRRTVRTYRVPDAPSAVVASAITQTTLSTKFTGNGDGGTPVLEWQLGYGLSSSAPTDFLTSRGTNNLTGLIPGETYYFWARGRNSVGWGPYSARTQATMVAGVRYKSGTTWGTAVAYINVDGVWRPAQPFVKIAGLWKETG